VAALAGGYGLSTAMTIGLPPLLPGPLAQAVLYATMVSFAAWCASVLWAFAARTALRAWIGIVVPMLILLAVAGMAS
jgi:hypothetical protein